MPSMKFQNRDGVRSGNKMELLSAIEAILFGALLLLPGMDVFTSSTAFEMFRRLASEEAWGFAALCIGLFQFLAALTKHFNIRLIAAFVIIFFYAVSTTLFIFGNFHSTAVISFSVFTGMAGSNLYELSTHYVRS